MATAIAPTESEEVVPCTVDLGDGIVLTALGPMSRSAVLIKHEGGNGDQVKDQRLIDEMNLGLQPLPFAPVVDPSSVSTTDGANALGITDAEIDAFFADPYGEGGPCISAPPAPADAPLSVDDGWDNSGFGPNDKDPITDVTPLNLGSDDDPFPYDAAEWPDHNHDVHIVDPATSSFEDDQLYCTD